MRTLTKFALIFLFMLMTAGFSAAFWYSVSEDSADPLKEMAKNVTAGTVPQMKDPSLGRSPQNQRKNVAPHEPGQTAAPQNTLPSSQPPQNEPPAPEESANQEGRVAGSTDQDKEKDPVETTKYESKKLGIRVDVPEGFATSEKNERVEITKDKKSISFKVYENQEKLGIEPWYKGHYDPLKNGNCTFAALGTKIGMLETTTVEKKETDCENGGLVAANADKTKIIKADMSDGDDEDLKKIVASFILVDAGN